MIKMMDGILDRLFALSGALLFSQAPEFFQQYTQRLSGHLAELQKYVNALQTLAQESHKTVPAYIAKFSSHSDPDIFRQGQLMNQAFTRYQDLQVASQAMQEASVWWKPFVFLHHLNADIVYGTLSHFKAGISLSLEGMVYAFLGLLVGYLFYSLIKSSFRFLFFKKSEKA